MTTTQRPATTCQHKNKRPPEVLGEGGPVCNDCGKVLPCPHPKNERTTVDAMGTDDTHTLCNWCGEAV